MADILLKNVNTILEHIHQIHIQCTKMAICNTQLIFHYVYQRFNLFLEKPLRLQTQLNDLETLRVAICLTLLLFL